MARIAVFGPHPDDQELGMGGTIAALAQQGHDVLLVDLTNGEPTPHGSVEARTLEAAEAARVLAPEGAPPLTRVCLGLPNREVQHTLAARHLVAATIRAWQASVLFVTYPEDAHPDHRAVTRIVEDARFDAKLSKVSMPAPVDAWTGRPLAGPGVLEGGAQTAPIYPHWLFYYYATHLRWVPDPSFVFDITGFLPKKLDAVRAYHTQFVVPERNRQIVTWLEASAVYFGSRIGTQAGEPFFTKEPVGLASLAALTGLGRPG